MANTIRQKRGTSDPGASDLVVGELAINTTDGGVFTKTDGGTVVEVGSSGGGGASAINDLSDAVTNSSGQTIGLGTGALAADDGSDRLNTAVGYQALNKTTTGHSNVALGYQAMYNTGTGVSEAIAIGRLAQRKSTADNNISIGYFAHYDLTSGGTNIAIGNSAGANQTTGNNNVCIGYDAGGDMTVSSGNVFVGKSAGDNVSGAFSNFNTALGHEALSGFSNTGGANTALGCQAGDNITTGSNNTCVGNEADASSATVSNEITLGNSSVTSFRIPGLQSGASTGHVLTYNSTNGNITLEAPSIPQNSQTSAYTLVAADAGKHVSITTGGVTVPSGVFSIGDVVSVYNNSGSDQTITQGSSVTLREAGTGNTGNRTLGQYGLATVLCVGSNEFVISGAGVS